MGAALPTNLLYFGDNLEWLRNQGKFPDESVDLVYLDPPFNSNRSYNVLFKESDVRESEAQIHAFEDTWSWDRDGRVQGVFDDFWMTAASGPTNLQASLKQGRQVLVDLERPLRTARPCASNKRFQIE